MSPANKPPIPAGECQAYHELPESIKAARTHEQWMWLSDAEKARLEQTETEPEDPL